MFLSAVLPSLGSSLNPAAPSLCWLIPQTILHVLKRCLGIGNFLWQEKEEKNRSYSSL